MFLPLHVSEVKEPDISQKLIVRIGPSNQQKMVLVNLRESVTASGCRSGKKKKIRSQSCKNNI